MITKAFDLKTNGIYDITECAYGKTRRRTVFTGFRTKSHGDLEVLYADFTDANGVTAYPIAVGENQSLRFPVSEVEPLVPGRVYDVRLAKGDWAPHKYKGIIPYQDECRVYDVCLFESITAPRRVVTILEKIAFGHVKELTECDI